jgi:hypothetical protein
MECGVICARTSAGNGKGFKSIAVVHMVRRISKERVAHGLLRGRRGRTFYRFLMSVVNSFLRPG